MGDSEVGWTVTVAEHLGKSIAAARAAKRMSAIKLSEATAALGMSVHRVAIPRIEQGKQDVTVPELIALGIALDSDATVWLIEATEHADIGAASNERMRLEATLLEAQLQTDMVNSRIETLRQMILTTSLPTEVKALKEDEISAWLNVAGTLAEQQSRLNQAIRRSKLGRMPESTPEREDHA